MSLNYNVSQSFTRNLSHGLKAFLHQMTWPFFKSGFCMYALALIAQFQLGFRKPETCGFIWGQAAQSVLMSATVGHGLVH